MSIISYICFLSFILLVISLFKKDTDVFSPGRLFILIWTLSIGLTDLKLSKFQHQWSLFGWISLFIPLASFLLGVFAMYVLNFEKPLKKISSIRESIKNVSINSDLLYKNIIILTFAYLISYLVTYLIVGYITIFTAMPDIARKGWNLFGFGLLVQSIPSILYLIVLFIFLTKAQTKRKFILIFLFFIAFITYFLLLQRYYLIFAIFISSVFLYYSSNKLRPRNVFIVFTILGSLFFWISSIRLGRYATNFLYYLSRMKFNIKYSYLTEPYMYIVMNLENFVNSVSKLKFFTYGLSTFDFIFALTGLKHPVTEYLHLPEYPNLITTSYNTYTMFFIYYWDYGLIGLMLIPFILGFTFSVLYYKMRREPNIHTISIYSIFSFVIAFSFFVPLISFLHFVFNLTLIYLITKLIIIPGNRPIWFSQNKMLKDPL